MTRRTGIMIDDRSALVVSLTDFGTVIERERSGLKTQGPREDRPVGDADSAGSDDWKGEAPPGLGRYINRVAKRLERSGELLVCGPDEAKFQLEKRLRSRADLRILDVRNAERVSDKKFVADVRKFFEARTR